MKLRLSRIMLATFAGGALLAGGATLPARAASDGNYRFDNQHCSGSADASNRNGNATPSNDYTEVGCHSVTISLLDNGGHEYFGIGIQQTAVGEHGTLYSVLSNVPDAVGSNVHQYDVWYDFGPSAGGCQRYTYDSNHPTSAPTHSPGPYSCPWMNPNAPNYFPQFNTAPNPATGLRLYIGADDNTAGGEHDASALGNGPSDGGGVHLALDPRSVMPWLLSVVAHNPQFVLQHPLPAGDGGIGFCVDGLCFSVQTQRQVAYQGGGSPTNPPAPDPGCTPGTQVNGSTVNCNNYPYQSGSSHNDSGSRDAAQYNQRTFDKPMACDSDFSRDPSTGKEVSNMRYCGNGGMSYWNSTHGTVYDEPGVQIYNDPDPDGDSGDGIYPHPGVYIGTCGIIVGGRPDSNPNAFKYPTLPSALANPQGQVVFRTGC